MKFLIYILLFCISGQLLIPASGSICCKSETNVETVEQNPASCCAMNATNSSCQLAKADATDTHHHHDNEDECPMEHMPCLCSWAHAVQLPPNVEIQWLMDVPVVHTLNWSVTDFQDLLIVDLPLQPPKLV